MSAAPVLAARRLTFLLTYACSAGALVLLWLVYPQDYSYGAAAGTGLQFYPGVVRAPGLPYSAPMLPECFLASAGAFSCMTVAMQGDQSFPGLSCFGRVLVRVYKLLRMMVNPVSLTPFPRILCLFCACPRGQPNISTVTDHPLLALLALPREMGGLDSCWLLARHADDLCRLAVRPPPGLREVHLSAQT